MNNNFIRSGNNNNRNRNNNNRNRNNANSNRRHGGGGGGGNPSNKVLDSNGPDVKLRGTPQTIAEKYMQMGRDAQSAGDSVAAENYYQHAEHYYRLWAASQPVGQSLQMSRKYGEEEFDENGDYIVEEEGENAPADGNVSAEGGEAQGQSEGGQQADQPHGEQRQPRNNNNRDQNNPGNRERFKPRWQNKRERFGEQPREGGGDGQPAQASSDEAPAATPAVDVATPEASGQWEAPSFLQRPVPIVESDVSTPDAEAEVAPKRGRNRKPRAEVAEETVAGLAEDTPPQGE